MDPPPRGRWLAPRLVEALREATRGDGRASLRYQTSPHHTDSTLWPVIRQLERAAELGRDDALEVRLDKLEALLARAVADPRGAAALLAPLLGLDGAARYPAPSTAATRFSGRALP